MKAEILCVGTEILLGDIVNTNAAYISKRLAALGIGVLFGLYFYLLYRRSKDKNLMPFFVAHMWGDIIGVGILHYLVG